jgi:hypothetical protein
MRCAFLRRSVRWWRRRHVAPPPPSPVHFPVQSLRQLGFFTGVEQRHFYVLYPRHGQPVPLAIWRGKRGFVVCPELGCGRRVVPFSERQQNFLHTAIAEERLYVLWDV